MAMKRNSINERSEENERVCVTGEEGAFADVGRSDHEDAGPGLQRCRVRGFHFFTHPLYNYFICFSSNSKGWFQFKPSKS